MNTNDTTGITTTIPARNLKVGMVVALPHYNHGVLTEIAEIVPMGDTLVRLVFVDSEETGTTYCLPLTQGVSVEAVELEMWFTYPNGEPGDAYTMRFPIGARRRHDMLRRLAGLVLDVPQRYIRINSTQGVAWDTRNPSRVAYFNN